MATHTIGVNKGDKLSEVDFSSGGSTTPGMTIIFDDAKITNENEFNKAVEMAKLALFAKDVFPPTY